MEFFNFCANGKWEEAQQLFETGGGSIDLSFQDNGKRTALALAATGGHIDILELLVNAGADIDAAGKDGNSPVMEALSEKKEETAVFLLKQGADVNVKTGTGKSCVDIAAENNQKEIIELIAIENAKVE